MARTNTSTMKMKLNRLARTPSTSSVHSKANMSQAQYKEFLERRRRDQESEDTKPIPFPKELDRVLFNTLKSVKCEMYPLDGLHWTPEQLATQSRKLHKTPPPKVRFPTLARSHSEPQLGIISSPSNGLRPCSKENAASGNSPKATNRVRQRTNSTTSLYANITNQIGTVPKRDDSEDDFLNLLSIDEDDLKTPTVRVPGDWPMEPELDDSANSSLFRAVMDGRQEVRDIDMELIAGMDFMESSRPGDDEGIGFPMPFSRTRAIDSGDSDPFGFGTTPESFKLRRANFGWADPEVEGQTRQRSWVE
ncbi:hypothetical protein AAF712_016460 [Marasmius tenuissimus]|uniref:Uncharacterized protein n=1 Tax=Marasmius tenuissimus TaxID=585030 RepID=A0ABR2Z7U2_9AGAR